METVGSMSKYFILGELNRREMHGYELMTSLERLMGKKPSPSQIYPVLKQMKSMGYVVVNTRYDGRKRIKYYTLTKNGKSLFKTMSKRFDILMRSALQGKIKICAHCGCEMIGKSFVKKIGGMSLDFCCSSCASSYRR